MSEVDDFARLRPLVDRFDEATKASLRAALFEANADASTEGVGPAPTKTASLSTDLPPAKLMESPGQISRRLKRGHRTLTAVAATLAVVGGLALIRRTVRRGDSERSPEIWMSWLAVPMRSNRLICVALLGRRPSGSSCSQTLDSTKSPLRSSTTPRHLATLRQLA